jgi:bifunctional NMN adenylyltransferase/nudix hydrolase
VRNRYFQRIPEVPASILSAGVAEFLRTFMLGEMFRALLEEAEFLTTYPAQWGRGPFVTADAVVVQSGHILLVERGRAPGKGLLALPGGFVNPEERIRDAAIRELREETSISDGKGQIPRHAGQLHRGCTHPCVRCAKPVLARADHHPCLPLPPARAAQAVQREGGDDAAHARWYRFGDLSPEMLFEDHWSIIEAMADL